MQCVQSINEVGKVTKVFIDPGHGGRDPGAVANNLQEKNLNLTIAKLIAIHLTTNYRDVAVKLSRMNDTYVSLQQRAVQANKWNANLFISVHVNAGGGTGFESYRFPTSRSGKTYQKIIHPTIIRNINVRDRGQKAANFYVLQKTKMPALLLECLFIDSKHDVKKLTDDDFLNKLASATAVGIGEALELKRK